MKTRVFTEDLSAAAELIRQGELVAVPTETVYGLAGNGLSEAAVSKIYQVKGRPERKPLSLMVSGVQSMERYCVNVPKQAVYLAERFWPGPLTIVLQSDSCVPDIVRAGGDTVALRCPMHDMTLRLLELSGLPLAAPSANPSGADSPKNAKSVLNYFDGRIAAVVDGGECGIGRESTIIDMSKAPYRVLRQGALPVDDIAEALADRLTVIGITGGTGCGKTTALRELEKRGALTIDCDKVYHELLESDKKLLDEIEAAFPETVQGGVLQRKALGAVVFCDDAALRKLNSITHRYIGDRVRAMLKDFAMSGGTLAAIDAIELIGSGLSRGCVINIGITADTGQRIERIMLRDGISREYAQKRVDAQRPNSYFIENCDYTVENGADRRKFIEQFNLLIEEVLGNG